MSHPVLAETTSHRGVNRVCIALFICSLTGLAIYRWNQSDLDRPLEYDEWHTLEYYGWAGLSSSGDLKLIRRAADFENLAAPNLRQIGLGLYRAVGVWKEPNNHVLHSVLVNLSSAARRSPRSVRLPAFAFGVLFSVLTFVLVGPVLRWGSAAPIAGIIAYCIPYVETYSFEARGYTMVLALQTLFLIFAFLLARRPESIGRAAGMAAAAAGCFVNVVSLALDWVFAVYLALYLVPLTADRRTWRRNIGAQLFALAAVFAVFVLDRLVAIVLASQRFGVTLSSAGEFVEWVIHTSDFLFPSWAWFGVLAGGVAGIVLMGLGRQYRGFAFLVGLVLLVNVVHFAAAKRCPYPRVCGYCLPLVVIGMAYLLQRGMLAVRAAWWRIPMLSAFAAILIGSGVASRETKASNAFVAPDGLPSIGVYAIVADFDYVATKHLPNSWLSHQESVSPQEVHFVALIGETDADSHTTAWNVGSAMTPQPLLVPRDGITDRIMDNRGVTLLPVHGSEYRPTNGLPESELIVAVWYPDQNQVGLDPATLMKLFDKFPVAYHRRATRLQANYDYYIRPGVFEMVAVSAAERTQLQELLSEGTARFGGRAIIYSADRSQPSGATR